MSEKEEVLQQNETSEEKEEPSEKSAVEESKESQCKKEEPRKIKLTEIPIVAGNFRKQNKIILHPKHLTALYCISTYLFLDKYHHDSAVEMAKEMSSKGIKNSAAVYSLENDESIELPEEDVRRMLELFYHPIYSRYFSGILSA